MYVFFYDRVDDVLSDLQTSGYEPLPESSRHVTDRYFCMDNLFNDTLVFATEQATELSNHWLVQEGHLVIQVGSSNEYLINKLKLTIYYLALRVKLPKLMYVFHD